MSERRVVITGIGAICPVGIGAEATWESIVAGRSGISPITHFDASEYTTRFAGYVHDFDPAAHGIDAKEQRRMARFIQMAIATADEAIADSGLDIAQAPDADRIGVIVGSGVGGLQAMEEQHDILLERGPSRVSPFLVPMMIIDLAAGHISIRHGAKGINYAPVSACATGTHAIGEAFESIKRNQADVIVAGAFDCGITPLGTAGFASARALSTRNDEPTKASRPFDRDRDGFVMGEGGGILVLEELEHARARGARIYGEVVGYGATADAHHITEPAPDGNGARRAMEAALAESGLPLSAIGYINAHGTSTPKGDVIEAKAVRAVFGDEAPPVSSTKSMTGHLLGGAGSLEAVICTMALVNGVLPPTINVENQDPEIDLDVIPNEARKADVDAVMSNSFGFGGHNATLIIARVDR
jgi:3-oxoacyl-[acyl-carrier-protein] synthase II